MLTPLAARRAHAAALAVLVTALAGCAGAGGDLQPLADGYIWRYAVTVRVGDATNESMLEERTTGRLPGAGAQVFGLRRQDGTVNLLEMHDGGVHRVGVVDTAGAATPIEPPEWVVPPDGRGEWTVASRTGLIRRRLDDFEEAAFRMPVAVDLRYRMLDGVRSVDVPLGRFEGCRELFGKGERRIVRNRRGQLTRISVEQHDFYCPGVGLALRERSEKTDNAVIYDGSYRQVLVELRRPWGNP